jgi:hypothetical protein
MWSSSITIALTVKWLGSASVAGVADNSVSFLKEGVCIYLRAVRRAANLPAKF